MIKSITTDLEILAIKSTPCFFNELEILKNQSIINDMLDTANYHKDECIGLASNQISEFKRIILVFIDGEFRVMLNPTFTPIKSAGVRKFKEGCLSYPDRINQNRFIRRRFKKIKVTFQWLTGFTEKVSLTGIDAVIVQHEIDHLNGLIER